MRNGTQGTEIDLLSSRLVRVVWTGTYPCCEVFDAINHMMLSKQKTAERIKIQPFIWRIFHCAVVEIETVNVDGGAPREKNKGRSLATSLPDTF